MATDELDLDALAGEGETPVAHPEVELEMPHEPPPEVLDDEEEYGADTDANVAENEAKMGVGPSGQTTQPIPPIETVQPPAAPLDLDALAGPDDPPPSFAVRPQPRQLGPERPPPGLLEAGNIDLGARPVVRNRDGTVSTVRSITLTDDKKRGILIPTVSDDGRVMSNKEAIATWRLTGKHLGVFVSPQAAQSYAEDLHEGQASRYAYTPVEEPWQAKLRNTLAAQNALPSNVSSDREKAIKDIAWQTRIPQDIVAQNFDEMERRAAATGFKPLDYAKTSEGQTYFALTHPEVKTVKGDDKFHVIASAATAVRSALDRVQIGMEAWSKRSPADQLADAVGVFYGRTPGTSAMPPERKSLMPSARTFVEDEQAKEVRESGPVIKTLTVPFYRLQEKLQQDDASGLWGDVVALKLFGKDASVQESLAKEARQKSIARNYQENAWQEGLSRVAGGGASVVEMVKDAGAPAIAAYVLGSSGAFILGRGKASGAAINAAGKTAARIVGGTAMVIGTMRRETGSFYESALNSTLDDGRSVPERTALEFAVLYGVLATAIEFGTGVTPALMRAAGWMKANPSALMRNVEAQSLARRIMLKAGKTMLGEGGEEMGQNVTEDVLNFFARAVSQGTIPAGDVVDVPETIRAGEAGALGAMATTGVTAPIEARHEASAAAQVQAERDERSWWSSQLLSILSESDSATAQDAPQEVADMVAHETAKTGMPVKSVHVDPGAFMRLFQTERDAHEAATELMGEDGPKKIQEAAAAGQMLEVPMPDYLKSWGGTEVAQALVDDTTVSPEVPTRRQQKEIDKQNHETIVKMLDDIDEQLSADDEDFEPTSKVLGDLRRMKQQLELLGYEADEVQRMMAPWHAHVKARVANARGRLSVDQLLGDYTFQVHGETPIVENAQGEAVEPEVEAVPDTQEPEGDVDESFEFGVDVRPIVSEKMVAQAGAFVGRMRDKAKRKAAQAWLDFTTGKGERVPVDPKLEKWFAGEYGLVDPEKGFAFDEQGRALEGRRMRKSGGQAAMPESLRREKHGRTKRGYGHRYEQANALRTGRETLEEHGISVGGRHTTRDIATALQERQRQKYGVIARDDFSDAAAKKIARWMTNEVLFEHRPENAERSGVGWYTEKWQRAIDQIAEVFPELKKDKDARDVFTALMAVTSDGQKVYTNLKAATQLYEVYRKKGSIPVDLIGSQRAGGMTANFHRINDLLEQLGPAGMREYLLEERTVGELRALAKEAGREFNADYRVEQVMPRAVLEFGPKLGAFYANLMGSTGYLTMDRWWSRTFNRYRGQLIPSPTRPGLERFKQLLGRSRLSDEAAIRATVDYRRSYEAKNFKNGTEIEKAANTIYKAAFEELEDTPFNATDREFMARAAKMAIEKLKEAGVDITVADLQATLWYYEKRLYAELGARSSADVSYEEVATRVVDERRAAGDQPRRSAARDVQGRKAQGRAARGVQAREVEGPDGAAFDIEDEDLTHLEQDKGEGAQRVVRGYTNMQQLEGRRRLFEIVLTKHADLSTFLHESAHVFMELLADQGTRAEADPQAAADWQAALTYMGVKDRAELSERSTAAMAIYRQAEAEGREPTAAEKRQADALVEPFEKFARGFETYLMEGKAPSAALRRAFERFRLWLVDIYKTFTSLGAPISDDIRGVFDRLLATQQEIDREKKAMGGFDSLFRNAEEMGVSPEEWAKHLAVQLELTSRTARQAELSAIRERLREQEAWWRTEEAKLREEAGATYDGLQPTRARDYLKLAGVTVADLEANPAEADAIATTLDYPTGEAMLKALEQHADRETWAKQRAAAAMAEGHGGIAEEREKLREQVAKGLHGDHTAKWLTREWEALRKKAGVKGEAPIEAIKRAAYQMVEGRTVGRLPVGQVLATERAKAEACAKAAAKGDYAQAHVLMQERLLNLYLHRAMTEARELREGVLTFVDKADTDTARARLGKAGRIYRDGLDMLLEAFGFTEKATDRELPLPSLNEVVRELEDGGATIMFDPDVVERLIASGKDWDELTVGQLREVNAALRSVQGAGRQAATILIDGKRQDREETVAKLIELAKANVAKEPTLSSTESAARLRKALRHGWNVFDGTLLSIEEMATWLGGDDLGNAWFRAIVKPLQDAKAMEVDLLNEVIAPVLDLFEKIPPEVRKLAGRPFDGRAAFPGHAVAGETQVEAPTKRFELLMMALNAGNESNLERLLDGRNIKLEELEAALGQLTKEEMDWVQSVWDAFEGLWAREADLEERLTGLRPPKLTLRPLVTRHGTYKGGYFPAVYDPRLSKVGRKQRADIQAQSLMDVTHIRPSTSHGHLKARATNFSAAISLEPGHVPMQLARHIHDLAFREAVLSVGSLVMDERVQDILNDRLGEGRGRQFLQWVKDVGQMRGADATVNASGWIKMARWIRGNTVIAGLGLSAPNAIEDLTNILRGVSVSDVKASHMAAAVAEWTMSPRESDEMAHKKSGELRTRRGSLQRDLQRQMKKVTVADSLVGSLAGAHEALQHHAFFMMEASDRITSTVVWMAAYRQAVAEGLEEADAVTKADVAIRKAFPSHSAVDMSGLMRDKGFVGMSMLFMGFLNRYYNNLRTHLRRIHYAEGPMAKIEEGAYLLATILATGVISEWLRGRGPAKNEPLEEWLVRKLLVSPFSSMPVAGDLANALELAWKGQKPFERSGSVATAVFKVGEALVEARRESKDPKKRAAAVARALGPLVGVPAAQLVRTGGYVWDVLDNEPDDVRMGGVGDVLSGLIYGDRGAEQTATPLRGAGLP